MISTIQGEIIQTGDDSVIVRVGGLGIKVFVTDSLAGKARPGGFISLYTHLVVREDSLTLFGFEDAEEEEFFTLCLGVNGVGPKTALAALSTLSVDAIRRAVLSEQPEIFSRIPGVGKKGAQKILLHLQGRVGDALLFDGSPAHEVDLEVIAALTSLGYSIVEAQAALQFIPKDAPEAVEERLRLALQYFST
ncbi:MAG: Holliday junction branch migration protein RuvA [Anaerolineaceae bacterium]|nr:Holliday junction branch migration protein RuvA [Anaerolineaceae bacterium]